MGGAQVLHLPVLVEEVVAGLAVEADDRILDCTVGSGGHSLALCQRLGPQGRLVGLDKDAAALRRAEARLRGGGCAYTLVQADFRHLDRVLDALGLATVSKILFDLGLSTEQLACSGRGFSFQRSEPLLMTFQEAGGEADLTAEKIVNTWSEQALAELLRTYGEERWARRIARAIVRARQRQPLRTSRELAELVARAVPPAARHRRLHPATRTFQALRIAVNDELGALREGLAKAFARLAPGGRLAVIAFHSLEDRLVKQAFRQWQAQGEATVLTPKPITPSAQERQRNPRARSAKLRLLLKSPPPRRTLQGEG
ncbi:MAG: ribosomal RNA small subunit methyltransferase H [Candidatus Tectimicrobiota bacterium]|nr:MAG: ribosomal RNA small subunit methyltransferase H [Candidatus Tectomicrobia bacterium]